ncbi:SDR family oxidoreductase [Sphingopyxis bauzanensis]|nr:SDR family oxidoreductase [Sphingopyxis bauzanensis]GGJ53167.1 dehydrogenase [Sphingopyxis bauzanensis]
MGRLSGKTAVVTGGSAGIGLATAKLFAAEGALVFITGRRSEQLDAAVAEIGGAVTAVQADSARNSDLKILFSQIKEKAGKLDILVVNAGGGELVPFAHVTEGQFNYTFDRNVKGVFFTVQTALPVLVDGASVILIGSTAGSMGAQSFSTYGASKAAVRNFARNWILDLKERRIRVNTLSPGPIRTDALLGLAGTDPDDQQALLDNMASLVPLGRVGEPEEVAKAALFLASDDSSYVNGSELFVDGGRAQI